MNIYHARISYVYILVYLLSLLTIFNAPIDQILYIFKISQYKEISALRI
jgi:hypothetical protein